MHQHHTSQTRLQTHWLFLLALLIGLLLTLSPMFLWAQDTPQRDQAEQVETHTVSVGETLSVIAERYGITTADLMAYNAITDPDAIRVGQVLTLPPGSVRQPEPTPLPTHEVQIGETLSGIALQYAITVDRLMLYNGLRNADEVIVGQRLRIPPPEADERAAPLTPATTEETTPISPISTAAAPATATTERPPTRVPTAQATHSTNTPSARPTAPVPTPTQRPTIVIPDTSLDDTFVQQQAASLNRSYTVEAGDTFARIALRTGVDGETLRRLNRFSDDEAAQLFVGQSILLPAVGDDLRVRQPEQDYVIQPGDSLGTVAEKFDLTLADLLVANRLADPDNISVGQRLTIPRPTTIATTMGRRDGLVGPVQNGYYYYTVQPGDTISDLAVAFDSTKLAIFEYNNNTLPDQETVYSGLEIRIPFGPPSLPNRHPPVPASGSSFLVSLSRQQCWLFHGDRVVHEWTCSTGYGEWITRVGSFAVQSKIENAESSAYQLDMPYWLGIYNVGPFENGIHGLPVAWDTGEKIWEGLIGEPATFGCAMLNDRDAAVLFDAAYIGMPVHIMN